MHSSNFLSILSFTTENGTLASLFLPKTSWFSMITERSLKFITAPTRTEDLVAVLAVNLDN